MTINEAQLSPTRPQRPRKMPLESLIQHALADENAHMATNALFGNDSYPTEDDLLRHRMNEVNYLALQQSEPVDHALPKGIIYTIPGGAASAFASEMLENDLQARLEGMQARKAPAKIHIFLMIHGAIAPNPLTYWDFEAPVVGPRPQPKILAETCQLLKQGFHAHNLHARGNFLLGQGWYEKLSCGAGAENTLDTREQAWKNYCDLKKWAESAHIPVNFFFVEAVTPLTGLPRWRIFNDDWSEQYADRIEPIHAFRRPGDNYRPPRRHNEEENESGVPQFSCCEYPIEKLLPFHALNDILRSIINRDEHIVGIACSDARQGLYMSASPGHSIDISSSSAITGYATQALRQEHMAGHSEPLGLIILGKTMQQIGCYLAARQFAILRKEPQIYPRIFSQAWPFLVNMPHSFWKRHSRELAISLEQLLCVIDQNYRKGLNPFFPVPSIYMRDNDEILYELVANTGKPLRGLHFLYPENLAEIVQHIRPGFPLFKLNLEKWGTSSHHIRSSFDRRSVDTFDTLASYVDDKSQQEWIGSKVSRNLLRMNARPNVGTLWPMFRRKLGTSVPLERR